MNPWDSQSIRQYDVNGVAPNINANSHGGQNRWGVCYPAAFMGGQGAKARSIAYCEDGTTPTLRAAPSGGNQVPDVCYPINTMVATRGGRDDMRTCFGIGEPGDPQFTISAAHEHGVCYAIQGNMVDRDTNQNGPGYMVDDCPTLNTVDKHAVCYPETARALTARHDSSPCVDRGQNVVALAWANSGNAGLSEGDVAPTIKAARNGEPAIVAFSAGGGKAREYDGHYGNISPTIRANAANTKPAVCVGNGQLHQTYMDNKTGALNCMHDQQAVLTDGEPPRKYIVRRLTPTECARLQGFPDEWCEGLGGSDSAIYKAYGNGLALPCAYDVMQRIARFVEREKEERQVG